MAINPKLLNEGESVVISTRTHPKALLAPILWLILFLAVAGYLQAVVHQGTVNLVVWIIAALLFCWFVLKPVATWLSSEYTFTNRRLITRTGLITRRGHDIPLTRISDVAYEKDLVDRLLGCGTLVISDASTHGQVPLRDIPRVEERQRVLNDLLHRLHDGIPGNEGI